MTMRKYLTFPAKIDVFQLFLVRAGKFTPCKLLPGQTPVSLPGEPAVRNPGLTPTTLSD